MPKKKHTTRNYRITDGALKQKADLIADIVERDMAEFATRGVSAVTVDNFRNRIEEFDMMPDDIVLQGYLMIASQKKDEIAEQLRVAIRSVRTMAANKWGEGNALYRLYDFDRMNRLTDEKLIRMAKRVIKVATLQQADLASEGLTPAIIANIETIHTQFDNAIDLQADAVIQRDIKTQERIDKGNLVFKELSRLCNTGKDLFVSTDEARYNDYIIYDTPDGEKESE